MTPRVSFQELSKDFGAVRAVDRLTLDLFPGEIFVFLGPNGAGKTTTIKMLVGLLEPTRGSVLVEGANLSVSPQVVKRKIGYIPDEPYLYEKLTGMEFLDFVGTLYGIPQEIRVLRRDRLIELFRLKPMTHQLVESYSHGMRQRLVYASVLLREPPLLVVDEPTVGLDPEGMRLVRRLFRQMADGGATILLSTHVLSLAEAIADRIGILHQGRLLACGSLKELLQGKPGSSGLEECFLRFVSDSS